jgi:hypothetical protein
MKKIDLLMTTVAIFLGMLTAYSSQCWMDGAEHGKAELRAAKEELVRSAGLLELHNQVYSKVGEHAWEAEVKPAFMSHITYATIRETGSIFPTATQVVEWVRTHPQEARRMLLKASDLAGK